MWNNNNYGNKAPSNRDFYTQNNTQNQFANQSPTNYGFNQGLTPPVPPAYMQNMPQYKTNTYGKDGPPISNQAFMSQPVNKGTGYHQGQGYRPFGNANPLAGGFNKGFKTPARPGNGKIGNFNGYTPGKDRTDSLSINKNLRSKSRKKKDHMNTHGGGKNLGDSFIPGYKQQTLSDRKLIWDDDPIDFYNDKGVKLIPGNKNYPNNPKMNTLKNYVKNIDTNNIRNNLGDSVLVNPNEISPGNEDKKDSLPKIHQEDSQLLKSNMLNFEFHPKRPRREGGQLRDRSKSRQRSRSNKRGYDIPSNQGGGKGKKWNNWVIESFIPKPAANSPHKNRINHSISFIASSKVFNLLKAELERKDRMFVDPKFPPNFESIWGFGESKMINKDKLRKLKWKNSADIFRGKRYSVFQGGIDPSDITQGMLGDCYFLSAISAIAEREDRIKKLFLQRELSRTGAYCVALCLNGMWEEVIVDDYFPCRPNSGRPAFNSSKKSEIWVMLLEKAWAKVHGGYLNIDGGLTREALHDLTGAPAITHYTDEQTFDEHWENIMEGYSKRYIMTAGSHDITGTGRDNRDPKTGLCGNHAYSLLAAFELKKSSLGHYRMIRGGQQRDPNNERVVMLRNPWGKGEWKGEWSDRDPRWNSDLKKELRHTLKEDGKFFMPFASFMKYFHDYQVCYYQDEFTYSSQRYNGEMDSPTFIHFKITKPGKYYFSINQINKRFFRKRDGKCPIPNTRLRLHSSYPDRGKEEHKK